MYTQWASFVTGNTILVEFQNRSVGDGVRFKQCSNMSNDVNTTAFSRDQESLVGALDLRTPFGTPKNRGALLTALTALPNIWL